MTRKRTPSELADRIEELKDDTEDDLPGLGEVLRGEAELPPEDDDE